MPSIEHGKGRPRLRRPYCQYHRLRHFWEGGGLRSDIGKGWLVADKKAAIRFKRLNADDYELTLPANAPDSIVI